MLAESKALLHIGDLPAANSGAQEVIKRESEKDTENMTEAQLKKHNDRIDGAIRILADAAEFGKKPELAREDLKELIDQTDNDKLKKQIMHRTINLDMHLHQQYPDKYSLAEPIKMARESLDIDPVDVNTHLLLGELLMADSRYTEAEDKFFKVLDDFNPENRRAFEGLFEINLALLRLDDAYYWYKKIDAFDPDDAYKFYRLARLQSAKGQFYQAMQSIDRLEEEGARGSVFILLYHGLTPSEWTALPSVRLFREQLMTLRKSGFKFITPNQLPNYFEAQPEPPMKTPKPWMKAVIDWFAAGFTGKQEHEPSLRDYTPELTACITFDDALRSSFRWGTPVAEELDTAFAMHVPIGNILNYDSQIASWEELRAYQDTGRWVLGSHLVDASTVQPVDKEGHLVYPLPNRIWIEEKNRLETLWEYHVRVAREFKLSRELMDKQLGQDESMVHFVAYPMGDIGQETYCNVDNAILGNLNEAELNYDIGFRQSRHGFTMKRENALLYQRHEVGRLENGRGTLRFAFENHPVFLARRTRAELASLQGKLYKAREMLDELERDGYPEDLLNELKTYVWTHLSSTTVRPSHARVQGKEGETGGHFFSDLNLGVEGEYVKDSEETEYWRIYGKAGITMAKAITFEGRYGVGRIKQKLRNYELVEEKKNETKKSSSTISRTTTTDGQTVTEIIDETKVTTEEVTIFTNIVHTSEYDMDETSILGQLNYQFENGAIIALEGGQRSYSAGKNKTFTTNNLEGQSEIVYAFNYSWKPTLALDAVARFEHDVMPSAIDFVTYDMVSLVGVWRVKDWWDILGHGHYYMLNDDNNIIHLGLNSTWLVSERQGFYLGYRGRFSTSDDDKIAYWTPYWLQRHFLLAEFRKNYNRAYADLQVRIGMGKEDARQEELDAYNERRTRATAQGWYPGESPEQGWESIVGVSASIRRRFGRHWNLYGQISVNFLKEYSERNLHAGLSYTF